MAGDCQGEKGVLRMKCQKCQAELPENAAVCPECGTAVEGEAALPVLEEAAAPNGESKKKPKKGLIIGCAAAAVAAAGGIAFGVASIKDPKDVVIDAIKGVFAETSVRPQEEVFGMDTLAERLKEEGGEAGFGLTLAGSADASMDPFRTGGLDLSVMYDQKSGALREDIGLRYGGMDLASLQLYIDDTYVKAALPGLSSRMFSINYAGDLASRLESSPLLQAEGAAFTEEERQMINSYAEYMSRVYGKDEEFFDVAGLWERYKEGSKTMSDLKAAMRAEKADTVQSSGGSSEKLTGYDVVIPKAAAVAFVRGTADFIMSDEELKEDFLEYYQWMFSLSAMDLEMEDGTVSTPEEISEQLWTEMEKAVDQEIGYLDQHLASDVTMKVYVNKAGELASLDSYAVFQDDEGNNINVNLTGAVLDGDYFMQNWEAALTVADDSGDGATLSVEAYEDYDDSLLDSRWNISLANVETASELSLFWQSRYDRTSGDVEYRLEGSLDGSTVAVTAVGIVDELEKGESLHCTADSIVVSVNDAEAAELTGEWYVRALDGEIPDPEGTELDVILADQEDWDAVGQELMNNVFSLLMGSD